MLFKIIHIINLEPLGYIGSYTLYLLSYEQTFLFEEKLLSIHVI